MTVEPTLAPTLSIVTSTTGPACAARVSGERWRQGGEWHVAPGLTVPGCESAKCQSARVLAYKLAKEARTGFRQRERRFWGQIVAIDAGLKLVNSFDRRKTHGKPSLLRAEHLGTLALIGTLAPGTDKRCYLSVPVTHPRVP